MKILKTAEQTVLADYFVICSGSSAPHIKALVDEALRLMPQGEKYHYIFTTPRTQRARSAQEMLALWGKEGVAINDPKEAFRYAQEHAKEEDTIFIGGSNYLVGEVLSMKC